MGDVIGLGWTSKDNSYATSYSKSKTRCVSLSFMLWEWAVACKCNLLPKMQESSCWIIKVFSAQITGCTSYSVLMPPLLPWLFISLLLPAVLPSPSSHILPLVRFPITDLLQSLGLPSLCLFAASPRLCTPLPYSQYPWEHPHCPLAQNRDSVSTFALEIHSSAAWESALPSYMMHSLRTGFSTLIRYSCVHLLSWETPPLPGSEKTRAFF